jgi:hypothetical protein
MAKFKRNRKALREGTDKLWRDFLVLSVFVVLFGAALIGTMGSGSMPQMKGAWVAQAMR